MAANPQNASAILGQLINNPDNRYAPPGYWFFPNQPNGVTAYRPATQPVRPARPATAGQHGSDGESSRGRRTRPAINQLRMNQQNPNNPLHQAAIVNRLETNPANFKMGLRWG